ncbi:MAG: VETF-like early transcription factor large subunit [Solumvirus sp.]|uniref:VETF-like early transcription factor large subunit n=1 Tax=Solumvirus sp. TaxID=2487773 RepID=A0A3G5AGI0_9VIRU|nr:MAG: VETF-like early transcription factor large subunit [Solumvirus sp.]
MTDIKQPITTIFRDTTLGDFPRLSNLPFFVFPGIILDPLISDSLRREYSPISPRRSDQKSEIKVDESEYVISDRPQVMIKKYKIEKSRFTYYPRFPNGDQVGIDDGPDIFAKAKIDEQVPFIRFYSDQYNLRRIFNNIKTSMISKAQNSEKDTITLLVLKESSYEKVEYLLDEGLLRVSDKNIIPKIEKSLNLQLVASNDEKLDLIVSMFYNAPGGLFIDENVLSQLLIYNARENFYIEESDKPIYLKSHLNIHYAPIDDSGDFKRSSGLSASGTAKTGRFNSPKIHIARKQVTSGESLSLKTPIGTNYLAIKILYIRNQDEADTILYKFIEFMELYVGSRSAVYDFFESYLPDFNLVKLTEDKLKTRGKKTNTTYGEGNLVKQFPKIFANNYAKTCPPFKEPLAITAERAAELRRLGKSVLAFPKDDPVMYLTCDPSERINRSEYAHLTMVNNQGTTSKEYPQLPCCAMNDNRTLNTYLEGESEARIGSRSNTIITAGKLLGWRGRGTIPKEISVLLGSSQSGESWWWRYGLPISPNSIIHCLLLAVKDEKYLRIVDQKDAIEYANNVRLDLTRKTLPELYRQEMYDYSDTRIINYLSSNDEFLDPLFAIHGLEEYFNVNIFVFGDRNDTGTMEVPRHKIFYSSSVDLDRGTVCIFRTYGSSANQLGYPQCELICRSTKDFNVDQRVDLHEENVTKTCYNMFRLLTNNITWSFSNSRRELLPYSNLYSSDSLINIFGNSGVGQFIDNYGKLRGYIVPITTGLKEGKNEKDNKGEKNEKGEKDNKDNTAVGVINQRLMTVFIPPSAPINRKVVSASEIPKIPWSTLKLLGGQFLGVSAVTRDKKLITAVWYPIYKTMTYGICIPIVPEEIPEFQNIISGPDIPVILDPESKPIIGRITKLRRTLDMLLQIIRYLYFLDPRKDFYSKYFTIDPSSATSTTSSGDSSVYYDLSRIPRVLNNTDIKTALVNLRRLAPTLINDSFSVRLYSQEFGVKIESYIRNLTKLPITQNDALFVINGFYRTPADFEEQSGTIIFIGDESYENWLERQTMKDNGDIEDNTNTAPLLIKNNIQEIDANVLEPYLFKNIDNHIYLIQNVAVDKGLERAINVGLKWQNEKINYGFHTNPSEEPRPYLVYTLNIDKESSKRIVLIKDNRGENETTKAKEEGTFVRILLYTGNIERYAAMLSI